MKDRCYRVLEIKVYKTEKSSLMEEEEEEEEEKSRFHSIKSNRKAMNMNWHNQKANPALKIKNENKYILQ